jgi:hypothetical protein
MRPHVVRSGSTNPRFFPTVSGLSGLGTYVIAPGNTGDSGDLNAAPPPPPPAPPSPWPFVIGAVVVLFVLGKS